MWKTQGQSREPFPVWSVYVLRRKLEEEDLYGKVSSLHACSSGWWSA